MELPENIATQDDPGPEKSADFGKLLLLVAGVGVLLALAFAALSIGYVPADDARRHVAKVLSGKDWSEIVVLNSTVYPGMDTHPGWHTILGFLHKVLQFDQDLLMVSSILLTWSIFALAPVFATRRAESVAVALTLIAVIEPQTIIRMLFGRPFILMAGLLIILLILWERLIKNTDPVRHRQLLIGLAVCGMAAVWIQSTWYLLALPVFAVFADTRFRWKLALQFSATLGAGGLLGAILTGHPVNYLVFQLQHAILSITENPLPAEFLVGEFQPYYGSFRLFAVVTAVFLWNRRGLLRTPRQIILPAPLILGILGMFLGFAVARFWVDWALPALYLLLAIELEALFRQNRLMNSFSARLGWIVAAGCVLLLYTFPRLPVSDTEGQRLALLREELNVKSAALPGEGGIVYASGMRTFYDLFYVKPQGNWRYQIGFETGLMPREDLEILARIAREQDLESWRPWLQRMRPEDRLIFPRTGRQPPNIPGMDWGEIKSGPWWIGRRTPERIQINKESVEIQSQGTEAGRSK